MLFSYARVTDRKTMTMQIHIFSKDTAYVFLLFLKISGLGSNIF